MANKIGAATKMVKHEDQETEDLAEESDSGIEEAPP